MYELLAVLGGCSAWVHRIDWGWDGGLIRANCGSRVIHYWKVEGVLPALVHDSSAAFLAGRKVAQPVKEEVLAASNMWTPGKKRKPQSAPPAPGQTAGESSPSETWHGPLFDPSHDPLSEATRKAARRQQRVQAVEAAKIDRRLHEQLRRIREAATAAATDDFGRVITNDDDGVGPGLGTLLKQRLRPGEQQRKEAAANRKDGGVAARRAAAKRAAYDVPMSELPEGRIPSPPEDIGLLFGKGSEETQDSGGAVAKAKAARSRRMAKAKADAAEKRSASSPVRYRRKLIGRGQYTTVAEVLEVEEATPIDWEGDDESGGLISVYANEEDEFWATLRTQGNRVRDGAIYEDGRKSSYGATNKQRFEHEGMVYDVTNEQRLPAGANGPHAGEVARAPVAARCWRADGTMFTPLLPQHNGDLHSRHFDLDANSIWDTRTCPLSFDTMAVFPTAGDNFSVSSVDVWYASTSDDFNLAIAAVSGGGARQSAIAHAQTMHHPWLHFEGEGGSKAAGMPSMKDLGGGGRLRLFNAPVVAKGAASEEGRAHSSGITRVHFVCGAKVSDDAGKDDAEPDHATVQAMIWALSQKWRQGEAKGSILGGIGERLGRGGVGGGGGNKRHFGVRAPHTLQLRVHSTAGLRPWPTKVDPYCRVRWAQPGKKAAYAATKTPFVGRAIGGDAAWAAPENSFHLPLVGLAVDLWDQSTLFTTKGVGGRGRLGRFLGGVYIPPFHPLLQGLPSVYYDEAEEMGQIAAGSTVVGSAEAAMASPQKSIKSDGVDAAAAAADSKKEGDMGVEDGWVMRNFDLQRRARGCDGADMGAGWWCTHSDHMCTGENKNHREHGKQHFVHGKLVMSLRMQPTLTVQVVGCAGLVRADSWLFGGMSDPYVLVHLLTPTVGAGGGAMQSQLVGKTSAVTRSLEPGWAAAIVKVPLPISVVQQLQAYEETKQERARKREKQWASEEAAAEDDDDDADDDEYEDDKDEGMAAKEQAKWERRKASIEEEEESFVPLEPPGSAARLVFEVWDKDIQLTSMPKPSAIFGSAGPSTEGDDFLGKFEMSMAEALRLASLGTEADVPDTMQPMGEEATKKDESKQDGDGKPQKAAEGEQERAAEPAEPAGTPADSAAAPNTRQGRREHERELCGEGGGGGWGRGEVLAAAGARAGPRMVESGDGAVRTAVYEYMLEDGKIEDGGEEEGKKMYWESREEGGAAAGSGGESKSEGEMEGEGGSEGDALLPKEGKPKSSVIGATKKRGRKKKKKKRKKKKGLKISGSIRVSFFRGEELQARLHSAVGLNLGREEEEEQEEKEQEESSVVEEVVEGDEPIVSPTKVLGAGKGRVEGSAEDLRRNKKEVRMLVKAVVTWQGRRVHETKPKQLPAGAHSLTWEGDEDSAGDGRGVTAGYNQRQITLPAPLVHLAVYDHDYLRFGRFEQLLGQLRVQPRWDGGVGGWGLYGRRQYALGGQGGKMETRRKEVEKRRKRGEKKGERMNRQMEKKESKKRARAARVAKRKARRKVRKGKARFGLRRRKGKGNSKEGETEDLLSATETDGDTAATDTDGGTDVESSAGAVTASVATGADPAYSYGTAELEMRMLSKRSVQVVYVSGLAKRQRSTKSRVYVEGWWCEPRAEPVRPGTDPRLAAEMDMGAQKKKSGEKGKAGNGDSNAGVDEEDDDEENWFVDGAVVEVQHGDGPAALWNRGVIEQILEDGSCDVMFDDGELAERVAKNLRRKWRPNVTSSEQLLSESESESESEDGSSKGQGKTIAPAVGTKNTGKKGMRRFLPSPVFTFIDEKAGNLFRKRQRARAAVGDGAGTEYRVLLLGRSSIVPKTVTPTWGVPKVHGPDLSKGAKGATKLVLQGSKAIAKMMSRPNAEYVMMYDDSGGRQIPVAPNGTDAFEFYPPSNASGCKLVLNVWEAPQRAAISPLRMKSNLSNSKSTHSPDYNCQ
jgi:hypothetical protein